ncbi:MAG TPA: choice-of-anchor P family protein [Solirubrobacteraceae bacterium]|nr:choice-of-anchor P family protein [Solirubrobacteraceae bacterium]
MAGTPATASLVGSANGGSALLTSSAGLPTVKVGRIAQQSMPCLPASGVVYRNQVNSTRVLGSVLSGLGTVLSAGVIENEGVATFNANEAFVFERSRTANVSLLKGVIAAEAVDVKAASKIDAAGNKTRGGSTEFLGLKIAGNTIINGTVAPNTTIVVPGVGTVILNEQVHDPALNTIKVTGIRVKVDTLTYKGDIRIGYAVTRVQPADAQLDAQAFELSAKANVAGILKTTIGRQNFLAMECKGTGGVEKSQPGVGLLSKDLGSLAVLYSAVNGKRTTGGNGSFAYAIAEVAKTNLLDGLITADVIKSQSNTVKDASGTHSNAAGSKFLNLKIGDTVIAGNAAPNTKISLGVADIWLNRQECQADGGPRRIKSTCDGISESRFRVTAIYIKVKVAIAGLGVGAEVRVAEAFSGVRG